MYLKRATVVLCGRTAGNEFLSNAGGIGSSSSVIGVSSKHWCILDLFAFLHVLVASGADGVTVPLPQSSNGAGAAAAER
jgi:hypothetical protein